MGGFGKVVATLFTYPYLGKYSELIFLTNKVVKSRLQSGGKQYNGTTHALSTILKDEGFKGLYKGNKL